MNYELKIKNEELKILKILSKIIRILENEITLNLKQLFNSQQLL